MDNIKLALTLLVAGFIIVFVVLILLIVIIMIYGKIIQKAQKNAEVRREKKAIIRAEKQEKQNNNEKTNVPQGGMIFGDAPDEIPDEIIAVIAAAVDAFYGSKPHKIKAVSRSRKGRSSWGSAGIMQNTRPF